MSFMIVGKEAPLYDLDMSKRDDVARASQFILHASLDMVDAALTTATTPYLKVVDRHNEQMVSAYVTTGGTRFLLLHDVKNEDGIKIFFNEVNELYVKLLLNPFYLPNMKIENLEFDARVRTLARRYLGFRE